MRLLILLLVLTVVAGDDDIISNVDENLMSYSPFYGLVATASAENSTTLCAKHLDKMGKAIINKDTWVIKMMDASGMPKGGLHWGGTFWLGNRRQCEATQVLKSIKASPSLGPVSVETIGDLPPFPIAYFAAYFKHHSAIQAITHMPEEFRMTLGLCLPLSCEEAELVVFLQKYFDSNIFVHQNLYNTTYKMEEVKKLVDDYSWIWEPITIATGSIIVFIVILCAVGTLYDIKYYRPMIKSSESQNSGKNDNGNGDIKDVTIEIKTTKKPTRIDLGLGYKILKSFSVYENNKIIFNTKIPSNSIPVIQGIRLFSMVSIIVGHSVVAIRFYYENRVNVFHLLDVDYIAQIIPGSQFSVDTFFCISGYLLAASFFQTEYAKTKTSSLLDRIKLFGLKCLKRFLRLTPSYMITLGITTVIFNWRYRLSPFWNNERNDLTCPQYWWRNLLYIHNVFPESEMCMTWSYYLSNDMQYAVITTFLLILSTMYFKVAASLMSVIFFGSIGYTVYVVYDVNFIPFIDEFFANMQKFYGNPIVRIGAYLVGVYTAYLVYHLKKKLSLNTKIIRLLWLAAFSMNTYIIFAVMNRDISLVFSVAYISLSRILWSVGICWALIACETQNGGLFAKIFGSKYWYPASRLTYMAYLLNCVVLFLMMSFADKAYQLEVFNLVIIAIAMVAMSYAAAYVFTVLFELPIDALNKIFFNYLKGTEKGTVTLSSAKFNDGFDSNENVK
ncbi:nose resistant to fluoxetine protein 6-like [Arctopsyche grandis]|uniref:nose resistant to fluoxetine protein 6-like n=1 Tax=Arctopsyche grandis TaxID=121162 RepID=UPI00406D7AAF